MTLNVDFVLKGVPKESLRCFGVYRILSNQHAMTTCACELAQIWPRKSGTHA